LLKHLADAGVTHIPRVEQPAAGAAAPASGSGPAGAGPTARGRSSAASSGVRESSPEQPAARPARERLFNTSTSDEATRPELLAETQELMARMHSTLQQKTDALCALAKTVAACRRCTELAETRTQTVFGVGNADADIMFIGEAPGADEDASGEPFVGRAGQLLNKIIEACTLKREDIYICNILRCRPPGNRNPLPQEAANCREFLDAQIRIVNPKYIVCWGTIAAQNLLGEVRPVGKLRRQFFQHAGASVLCTYHPSYLLRNPSAKKDVWEDMKLFMGQLGVELK
jgi:DNA polymerase